MKPPAQPEPKVVAAYAQAGKNITREQAESMSEEQRRAQDQARIDALKAVNRNKFARIMGARVVISQWTHPCLIHPVFKRQFSVTEFYPNENLAVDKFYSSDEWEIGLSQFKRKSLNNVGVKYVCLTPDKDMADAFAEIEQQKV